MNCWDILGVDPSSDPKTIKRAYARLLKAVHPEEHPEDFMVLRQAYETALAYIAHQQPPVRQDTWEPDQRQDQVPECVVVDEPTPSEEELEYRQYMQRLQQLADNLNELLLDPLQRNNMSRWEALLLAPELNSFKARLAVGTSLLPRVLQLLDSQQKSHLPPAVLVKLDDRFQWSTDRSAHWPVSEIQLKSLSLLVDAAKHSLSLSKKPLDWEWLERSMFKWKAPLSRLEYFFVQGMTVGAGTMLTTMWPTLERVGVSDWIYLIAMMVLAYAFLVAHLKRIQDTNMKAFGVFLLSIFVPFVHVIIIFGSRPAPLFTGNDPRIRFTDPYQVALDEYVQGRYTHTVRKRVGSFFSALEPSLLSALVFIWLVNLALIFL